MYRLLRDWFSEFNPEKGRVALKNYSVPKEISKKLPKNTIPFLSEPLFYQVFSAWVLFDPRRIDVLRYASQVALDCGEPTQKAPLAFTALNAHSCHSWAGGERPSMGKSPASPGRIQANPVGSFREGLLMPLEGEPVCDDLWRGRGFGASRIRAPRF